MNIPATTAIPVQQVPEVSEKTAPDPALVDATRQFEAVFIQHFLGEALKPVLHDTLESKGAGAGIYQYMMTGVIANSLAEQEQFGISSALQIQLTGEESSHSPMRESNLKTVTTEKKP